MEAEEGLRMTGIVKIDTTGAMITGDEMIGMEGVVRKS